MKLYAFSVENRICVGISYKDKLSNLQLQTYVNGKLMQDGNTSDWVFSLPEVNMILIRSYLKKMDIVSFA